MYDFRRCESVISACMEYAISHGYTGQAVVLFVGYGEEDNPKIVLTISPAR
jgi:hypothetical protein